MKNKLGIALLFSAGITAGVYLTSNPAHTLLASAVAKAAVTNDISPVKPLARDDIYYPGTEAIGPNEMRVTALGTGMPFPRPSQAGACFLVELGNGDNFVY